MTWKEPWQMTNDEFGTLALWLDACPSKVNDLKLGAWTKDLLNQRIEAMARNTIEAQDLKTVFWSDGKERDAAHRIMVKRALVAGCAIPPEVLNNYPDLAVKASAR